MRRLVRERDEARAALENARLAAPAPAEHVNGKRAGPEDMDEDVPAKRVGNVRTFCSAAA